MRLRSGLNLFISTRRNCSKSCISWLIAHCRYNKRIILKYVTLSRFKITYRIIVYFSNRILALLTSRFSPLSFYKLISSVLLLNFTLKALHYACFLSLEWARIIILITHELYQFSLELLIHLYQHEKRSWWTGTVRISRVTSIYRC